MRITLNLTGTNITIAFLGQTKEVAHVYHYFFNGFITKEERTDALLNVSFLSDSISEGPFDIRNQDPTAQAPLLSHIPNHEAVEWLKAIGETSEHLSFSKETICTLFLNGLLLYSPETAKGRIYILRDGLGNFRSLYFLFWLYFAQVLGEKGGCFLHAAALVKEGRGHLFLGDSGSGKSTLSRLCNEYQIFSDDGPIVHSWNGLYRVCPSPFHQQDSLNGLKEEAITLSAPITRFYFLVKDKEIFLEEIPRKKAFSMILTRHVHFFQRLSTSAKLKLFDLFSGACDNIPLYYFHFSKEKNICSYLTQIDGG